MKTYHKGAVVTGAMDKAQESVFIEIDASDMGEHGKVCSSCKKQIEKGESFIMWATNKFHHLRCAK